MAIIKARGKFHPCFVFNKLMSVFHVSVLLLIMNFVIRLDARGDSGVDLEITFTKL